MTDGNGSSAPGSIISTIYVNGVTPADPLVYAGDGPTLIGNTDINNTVWIGHSNAIMASRVYDTIQLTPQSWVVVDGKETVYGITNGPIVAVNLIPGGLAFFQSGISGGGFVANQNGCFFYNGFPGPGNLIMSISNTNAPGTDPYGNVYTPGTICIGSANGVQILLRVISALQAAMQFPTNTAIEQTAANLTANNIGSGASEFLQFLMSGPQINVAGAHEWVQIILNSANAGATSVANMELVYVANNQTPHTMATVDLNGLTAIGSFAGIHPGVVPATQETWQQVAAGGSPAWSGTVFYKMCAENEIMIVAQLTAPSSTPINNTTFATLPAAYRPTTAGIQFGVTSSSGTNATCTLGTDGTMHFNGVTSPSSTVWIGPIRFPLDV
jgi:hypothetical protein